MSSLRAVTGTVEADAAADPTPGGGAPAGGNADVDGDAPANVRRGGWRLMREVALVRPRWIVLGVLSALGWTLAKIAIPLFALQAINDGIDPYNAAALAKWTGGIVVLTLLTGTFTYFRRTAAFAVSLRAEAELRRRLFDHLQRLHFGYHDGAQIGELMARVSTDAKQVQMLLVFIPIAGANVVMVVGVAIVLFVLNAKLAIVALATLPFLLVFAIRFSTRMHPIAMGLQRRLAGVSHVVEESLSGIRVVKGFGAEELQNEHLAEEAGRVYERGMAMAKLAGRSTTRCSKCCRRSASSASSTSAGARSSTDTSPSPR